MICRLCLKDIAYSEIITIFGEVGLELNVAEVLEKYFWFKPKNDDPISTAICNTCWRQVSDFNEFYTSVEEAHRLLTERFSVKREDFKTAKHKLAPFSDVGVENEQVAKSELNAEQEFRFNLLLEEECAYKETTIKPNAALSNDAENEDKFCDEQPFDDDSFMQDVAVIETQDEMDNKDHLAIFKEELDKLSAKDSDSKRRSKRAHLKANTSCVSPSKLRTKKISKEEDEEVKADNTSECDQSEIADDEITTRKRRGRPSKNEPNAKEKISTIKKKISTIKKKGKDKSDAENSADTEMADDGTKAPRIDEGDTKISQYMRLTCFSCDLEQPTFFQLRKHISTVHHCEGYAVCCNRKFYKRTVLLGHIEKHLNPDYYKCDQCDKVLADKQCLRNHILLKHQPDEMKHFSCPYCSKKFAKAYLLEYHRVTHEARSHMCDLCDKGFPSVHLLKSHVKIIHQNYGTMCDICAKVIRGRAAFTKHQLEHAGITQPKVQCDKCGSWHKNKYSLQKHKRRHNEDGTVHICNICGKVSPNHSALQSHKRYVHDAERPYECSVCNKAFKKPVGLREHMAMHTGEVLYKCPHCIKTFNSNANMHSHRKKVHPKEFEEARKRRADNSTNDNQESTTSKALIKKGSNAASLMPQLITIKTNDDGKTHKILVTTEEGLNDEHNLGNDDDNSIIFTVN